MNNEKGFTLLESIFVLSIFFIIVSLSFLLLQPQNKALEKQLFFSRLKGDLLYVQQYAISHQESVTVNFINNQQQYYAKNSSQNIFLERKFSKEIKFAPGSLNLVIRFNPNGNITQFGSIYIYIKDVRYRLTFMIGKGRFYVIKE
ncbi:competence type IV pilus minor pilin ComGD (plasmid) [Bacillus sp. 31A1R]|uniref:Competence type IV pilus minor pilin ComGD n=1 Tax=Robertmurraya mangrovi TaxID=3098077 RepID=A0ABU5IV38_9BACI|nr:competence type IV pilus minor pilin ComGD [Bacillus sp. 31A1R]MDZ5471019.1 competence type IV pilus minor pilin ComGD [Bacillus sp. 31A1R]